jgi:hypothetical protein
MCAMFLVEAAAGLVAALLGDSLNKAQPSALRRKA